jgi:hypothetical protein
MKFHNNKNLILCDIELASLKSNLLKKIVFFVEVFLCVVVCILTVNALKIGLLH